MSQQLDRASSRAAQSRGLIAVVVLIASLLGSALLVAALGPQPATAHEDPLGCTANGLTTTLGGTPAGVVQHGDVITYTVSYSNTGVTACNLTNLNATLKRPNGVITTVLSGATLNVGATINCPGDVGCAAGPYTYTVAHVDETGPVSGCPPVPSGTFQTRVTATAQASGTLHSVDGDDTATDCKTLSKLVVHTPDVATAIHNPAHQTVTSVPVGTTVHDSVSVTDPNALGTPTGSVTFSWFTNGTCTLPAAATDTQTLVAGAFDDTGFAFTPASAGLFAFRAHYNGDGNFTVADSPCEPLNVVDANIQITPATDTDEINDTHTLTGHVNINDGTGQTNAPAGTTISFAIASGPGSLGSSSCLTSGGTGSCTVTLTSATPGTTVVNATTTVSVLGNALTRTTNGVGANSGPASKTWVDANIPLPPATDTDAIGDTHTLTAHVNVDPGTGFVNAADGTVITVAISGGPGTPASQTCTTAGGTGSCTVTITSATPGTTTLNATTTVVVGGVSLTRTTNGTAGNSGPATKTWVEGNIQITPATDTDAINDIHTLTGHVNINSGGGLANAPDGTTISFAIASGPGVLGASSCTTTGGTGSCTVAISSATAGTTTLNATTTVLVGGVSLTFTTNGSGGNSGPANKTWVDANIQITPATDTDAVGDTHTLTAHVNVDPGTGFVNAADGTVITVAITGGPGTPASQTCTTAGGTGSCTVTITSATPGTTTLNATTTVAVGGVSLTRTTNGINGNSGSVSKTWVDANIQITLPTDTDAVGDTHTLTGHVNVNPRNGFVNAADGTVVTIAITDGPGTPASQTCTTSGGTGSCTVAISSATAGTTTLNATTTVVVGGVSLTRTTNGTAGNSGPATKTGVEGNIQSTPPTDTDAINDTHTLTAHVNVNPGTGFVNAADGTTISFAIASGPGSLGASSCTTSGGTGSCTVTLSSATPGTTVVNATSTVLVGGVSLTFTTNGSGGNSGPANKTWVDANIQLTPATDTDAINDTHTLTAHVNVNPGTGFVNAADGTVITVAISGGPGTPA